MLCTELSTNISWEPREVLICLNSSFVKAVICCETCGSFLFFQLCRYLYMCFSS